MSSMCTVPACSTPNSLVNTGKMRMSPLCRPPLCSGLLFLLSRVSPKDGDKIVTVVHNILSYTRERDTHRCTPSLIPRRRDTHRCTPLSHPGGEIPTVVHTPLRTGRRDTHRCTHTPQDSREHTHRCTHTPQDSREAYIPPLCTPSG